MIFTQTDAVAEAMTGAITGAAERPGLPAEVTMVMSALEAGRHRNVPDRRGGGRRTLRMAATLRLFADQPGDAPRVVYTRDVAGRNVGLLSRVRLPLGYGGTIELPGVDGAPVAVACVLLRCSPAAPGWYDACAAFNRLQPQFE